MTRCEHLVLRFAVKYNKPKSRRYADHLPEADRLVAEMQNTLDEKQQEGWYLVSMSDVLAGHFDDVIDGSYGYCTTDSIIVILCRDLPA